MKKTQKRIALLITLSLVGLSSNVAFAAKRQEVKLPVQLKPERLELLNRIADEKIRDEDYPYKNEQEIIDVSNRIKLKEQIVAGQHIEPVEKLYRTLTVDMSPSSDFETIYMVPNFSTTVVFVDKLGNPWSIDKFIVGGAEDYHPEQQNKNIITFSPTVKNGSSNLTVIFKDGKLPISFNLKINSQKVDYITEMKIDGYGDTSPKEQQINFVNNNGNKSLLFLSKFEEKFMGEMLSNNLPSGFEEKFVYNKFNEAQDEYRVYYKPQDKFLYIRTINDVFSPKTTKQRIGVDRKTKVFKIPYTSTIIVNANGKMETLKIK